ncbi:MAG: ADP-ribosylglycohydrolase family protein [Pseudonocardiaceae bacterium]
MNEPTDGNKKFLKDRALGALLAGAVGDALGAPIEFMSIAEIRRQYGPAGLADFDASYGRSGGAITDDTQMTLFTLEGLIRARGGTAPEVSILQSYLRWLHTQGVPWHAIAHSPVLPEAEPSGWLIGVPELHSRRAPGNTCLSALQAATRGTVGSISTPINNSKGCGAVMRAAPAGFSATPADSFELGCRLGALTHGHPCGYLPAGVLAAVVSLLLGGANLGDALRFAMDLLQQRPAHHETSDALEAAIALAARGRPTPEDLETLGAGWTGEEALAIAVCAAIAAPDLEAALLLAVNHSGDSDSTGAICGNLLGARDGVSAVPSTWLDRLELRAVIERLAAEAEVATWALRGGRSAPARP